MMKRFIVTYTEDYYSGGPSIGNGFIGDFDTFEEAVNSLKRKMGSCCTADILDTKTRTVKCLSEKWENKNTGWYSI